MKKFSQILFLTITLFIGFILGVLYMTAGQQGLDGEYFRALQTVSGAGIDRIDAIFRYCVVLLVQTAKWLGISYEALNIWVFIIIQPLIILLLSLWIFRLKRSLRKIGR